MLSGIQGSASRRVSAVLPRRFRRSPLTATRAALDPDNSSILVCGGGGVGLHTTEKLKDMGAWVWMLQRSENNRPAIEKMMAFLVKGDAMEPETLKKAMAGIEDLDAVVSTVGGSVENPQADGEGNVNIINAAVAAGVKKFVLVTSIGTGDSKDAPSKQVYDVLKPVLIEKEKAEAALKAQDQMEWIIIRPGGLTDDDATDKGFLTESKEVVGAIARKDVASLVAKALFSGKVDGKVLSALDAGRVTSSAEFEAVDL